MNEYLAYLFPLMIIMSIQFFVWMIKYPNELFELLMFRSSGLYNATAFGLIFWLFACSFIFTVAYILLRLIK